MIRNVPPKHPDSDKWYWFAWSNDELQGATIATLAWTVPAGISKTGEGVSGQRIGIKLSGGTLSSDYEFTGRITTSAGETLHLRFRATIALSGH